MTIDVTEYNEFTVCQCIYLEIVRNMNTKHQMFAFLKKKPIFVAFLGLTLGR